MSDAADASERVTSERIKVDRDAFSAAFAAKGCASGDDRARLLEMPRRSVHRYTTGEVKPSLPKAREIAAKLGLDVDDLWPAA
jgi:DNA-binding XRE family transcriptional regulator